MSPDHFFFRCRGLGCSDSCSAPQVARSFAVGDAHSRTWGGHHELYRQLRRASRTHSRRCTASGRSVRRTVEPVRRPGQAGTDPAVDRQLFRLMSVSLQHSAKRKPVRGTERLQSPGWGCPTLLRTGRKPSSGRCVSSAEHAIAPPVRPPSLPISASPTQWCMVSGSIACTPEADISAIRSSTRHFQLSPIREARCPRFFEDRILVLFIIVT